jgi:ADP-heptose:LPS heptosyltransferase
MTTQPEQVSKLLFISLSCVGDAVMTTPVMQALHQYFPRAVIDIVSDRRSSVLYTHCPYRGEIYIKDKHKLFRGGPDLLRQLRDKSYDCIVDLRTDGLAYLLKAKKRYTKWQARPYGPHAVEKLMGVIHSLHGDLPIPPARIWTGKEDEQYADALLQALPGKRWLALAPAVGGKPARRWPTGNYASLANKLQDLFDAVILAGGPGERQYTETVAGDLVLPHLDVTATSLLQLAAILKRADMFVGSDSGLAHVAVAVGAPALAFFSLDRPERVLPWGNRAVWLMGENEDARNISVQEAESSVRKCMRDGIIAQATVHIP